MGLSDLIADNQGVSDVWDDDGRWVYVTVCFPSASDRALFTHQLQHFYPDVDRRQSTGLLRHISELAVPSDLWH